MSSKSKSKPKAKEKPSLLYDGTFFEKVIKKSNPITVKRPIRNKYLDHLEADNYREIIQHKTETGNNNSNRKGRKPLERLVRTISEDNQQSKLKIKKRKIEKCRNKKKLTFEEAFDFDRLESLPSYIPSYLTAITNAPSTPRRRFCCCCGLLSKYKCKLCRQNYCSIPCNKVHEETRCLSNIVRNNKK